MLDWAREHTTYEVICLHTNRRSPGALDFWLAQGARVVAEAGAGEDPRVDTVYLEFPPLTDA